MKIQKDEAVGVAANRLANAVLHFFAFEFTKVKKNQDYLKNKDGWTNFSIGLTTEDGSVAQSIWFKDGTAKVKNTVEGVDTKLILQDVGVLAQLATLPPNEVLNLMLKNKMASSGNMAYLELFNLLISVLMKDKQVKQMHEQIEERAETGREMVDDPDAERVRPPLEFLKEENADPGVKYIRDDMYLSTYSRDDYPRLADYLDRHLSYRPAVCVERAQLLTEWCRENGFETKKDGTPWVPELRQAYAFKYMMEHKQPILRKGDLLAGTTTTKEIGVPIYPDGVGALLWGELLTVSERMIQPYEPLKKWEIDVLNKDVFPFWVKRSFREYVRDKYNEPVCQQLDERWAACFMWKTVALSHTILDYPKLLRLGLTGIIEEVKAELAKPGNSEDKKNELQAMIICYEGMIAYARNLAKQVRKEMKAEPDPERRKELKVIADAVEHSPEFPARNMDEAVHAIWVHWIGVHMESTNAGFSLGRMDQWLQPVFESDMAKLKTKEERDAYVKHVIELLGCFYLRCQDHVPMVPDIGNYLFGGSSSDQAITLGGITPEGEDAVNDMTYVFLKVTEILGMRGVVGHAEHIGQTEHGERTAKQCLGTLAVERSRIAQFFDACQCGIGRTDGGIVGVPQTARVVAALAGHVDPLIDLLLVGL